MIQILPKHFFFVKKGVQCNVFIGASFHKLGKKKTEATKCTKDFFGKNKLKSSHFKT
jgi:hypothetical protein